MDNPIHMTVRDSREQLLHINFRNIFIHVLAFDDTVEEFAAVAELHDDVDKELLLVDIDDADDIGVVLG